MKKLAVVLLIPILVFSLVSCDADIRAKFADAMGKLNGNVWIDSGAVKPSTAGVDGVTNVVNNVTPTTPDAAIADLGLADLGVTVDTSSLGVINVLKPQSSEEKKALEESLSTALNSTTQTQQLIDTLSQKVEDTNTVEATQGSMKVAAAALTAVASLNADVPTEIKNTLESFATALNDAADSSDLTQADVVTVQLITNLVSSTASAVKNIDKVGSDSAAQAAVTAAIDDSLFVVNVAQQLSGVGNLDLTQMLNLSDLMNMLNGSKALSRDIDETSEVIAEIDFSSFSDEVITYINQISKIVVAYVGASDQGVITEADYNRMIRSLKMVRSAYDNAMSIAKAAGLENIPAGLKDSCGLTGMMDYAIAVVFPELDTFGKSDIFKEMFSSTNDTVDFRSVLQSLLVHSEDLLKGTVTKQTELSIGKGYYDALKQSLNTSVAGDNMHEKLTTKLTSYAKIQTFQSSVLSASGTIKIMSDISGNTLIYENLEKLDLEGWFNDINQK